LRHGQQVLLHTGTAEVSARAIVLGAEEIQPGKEGWVQLYLEQPVAAAAGDRFVVRLPSPAATVGGGVLTDPDPRRHHRHDVAVRESLERRAAGEVLREELRKYPRGITEQALLKATLADGADVSKLEAKRAGQWLFAPEAWAAISSRAARTLEEYHRLHPLRAGMPREEMKSRLGLQPAVFAAVLGELTEEQVLALAGGELALPSHRVEIDPA